MNEELEKLARDVYLEALGEGRYIYLSAYGLSMHPFIKNYDILTVEPAKDGFKRGDIAIVDLCPQESLKFVAHRIVNIKSRNGKILYFIKGDNCVSEFGGYLPAEKIKGRVKQIKRKDLIFNFSNPFIKRVNILVALISYRAPRLLMCFRKIIDLLIEWPWFFKKVKTHFKKGREPFLYNAEKLILILSRRNLDARLINEAIAIIIEGLYWTKFCDLVASQGTVVLIYDSLKKIEKDIRIPEFVFDKLAPFYLFMFSRTASQYKELIELLELFDRKNIHIIPLKGTYLSKRLYNDIAARGGSVDFDFLIEEKDKDVAKDILEGIGYQCHIAQSVKNWQWNYNFEKIHLHWDITMMNRSKERIEGLWRGTRLVNEGTVGYYEFKQEELILYLTAHLVNSADFADLRYLCDINELLYRYKNSLDWDSIVNKSKEWRLSNSLYLVLMASQSLFYSYVPIWVLRALKPNFLKLLLIKIFVNQKVIFRKNIRRQFIDNFLSYIFFELIEAHSVGESLSIFKRVFFPPKEVMGKRNYFMRIFKGAIKLLKNI